MNDRLLEILTAGPDFTLSEEDQKHLSVFSEYLDRGSLFLSGFSPSDDPVFYFTNEAQRYSFSVSQIRGYVLGLKQGRAMDWESVPYELVSRGE